jgi:NAD(P)H-hydrate epimerase
MQLLVTAEQMQRCDRAAITRYRIPGLLLMENAGRAVVDHLMRIAGPLEGKHIVVVCGGGNNGGDGFVVARHLLNLGARTDVVLAGRASALRGDARTNFDAFSRLAGDPAVSATLRPFTSVRALGPLRAHDIVVDALFGTGFAGEVRSPARELVGWINRHPGLVVAVDIPSGVDAASGAVTNIAVRARATVTMGLGKIGHYLGDGREHAGEVLVADIGIPRHVLRGVTGAVQRVLAGDVRDLLPHRALRAHKYSVGKVLVIGGSRSYTGAPVMTAQAALVSGAGAVVLGIPESIRGIVARKVLEVMLQPAPENSSGSLTAESVEAFRERIAWADAVAAGPGLALHPETAGLVPSLLREARCPLLLDADALTHLSGRTASLRKRAGPTILTPHAGELARLMGSSPAAIEADRVHAARTAARNLGVIVVLKGAPTVSAEPAGRVVVNSSGNPGMATVGSGDVLAGIIASLAAQGMSPFDAAFAGVFVHGRAGDLAAARLGQRSLLAGDIGSEIPAALRSIESA